MNDSKTKAIKHPNIPILSDSTIERAMRYSKEADEIDNKAVDFAPVDKMQRSPVVKK